MSVHEDTATLYFHIEDYEIKLLRSLHQQAQEGRSHDITLTAHGVDVRAHQAVLTSHSEYFEALLSGRWSETDHHDLSNLVWSAETVRSIVDFMYTGKLEITKDNIEELLNTATHLLIDDLRGACSKYFLANLAPKNCLRIWQLSDRYQLFEVEAMCAAIATSRMQDYLLKRLDMLELDQFFLEKTIKQGLFDNVPRCDVTDFLAAWQRQHGVETIPETLNELISQLPAFVERRHTLGHKQLLCGMRKASDCSSVTLPHKCKVTEAIFAYMKTNEKTGNGANWGHHAKFDIYMFIPRENCWKFLDEFDLSTWNFLFQTELVGFIGEMAVFDGGLKERSALVDFPSKLFRTISFPNHMASSRRMFCFESKLFLIEEEKDTQTDTIACNLYIFQGADTMLWQKLTSFDLSELFVGFHTTSSVFSYTALPVNGKVYIWVQDQTSQSTGPFWMCFERDVNNVYSLAVLQRQPLIKGDLRLPTPFSLRGWKHATFRLSTDREKIYVHRQQSLSEQSLTFDVFLTYDIDTNSWSRTEESVLKLPTDMNLPIHSNLNLAFPKTVIQIDSRVQSLENGSTYIIEKLCPFVTRMWEGHINKGAWRQLTPPPIENIEDFNRFSVVAMPECLISVLGTASEYKGFTEDASQSPMFNYDLCLTNTTTASDIRLQYKVSQCSESMMDSYTY